MNINPEDESACSLPTDEEIRNAEAAASKALSRIQSLYNEIMTPKAYSDHDHEVAESDYIPDSCTNSFVAAYNDDTRRHYKQTKSRPTLCDKCRSAIPRSVKRNADIRSKIHCGSQNYDKQTFRSQLNNADCYSEMSSNDRHFIPDSPTLSINNYKHNTHTNFMQTNLSMVLCKKCKKTHLTYNDCETDNSSKVQYSDRTYENELPHSQNNVHREISTMKNCKIKVTIPRPFSLTAENIKRKEAKELKISKLKEELDKQVEEEMNVKVSSKPVPKHVRLPLYSEMVQRNERRKQERRDRSLEIAAKSIRPFNLSISTRTGMSKSAVDLHEANKSIFKAKPVPKCIFDENVAEKIRNKEEIRKLLVAQRAEDMLKQSTLPFSPKHISHAYSEFNISYCDKKDDKVCKANISDITKRLYTMKCRETLENWNTKVLKDDHCQSESNYKKNTDKNLSKLKSSKVNALPFSNFPVRMSTAALLRNKRIRTDILLRQRREEEDQNIREELDRRRREILKDIWPRLKSIDATLNLQKEIEDKVKSHKKSQKNREQEYVKELEDMMERVGKQFLLIERQSKEHIQEQITPIADKKKDSTACYSDNEYEEKNDTKSYEGTDLEKDETESEEVSHKQETGNAVSNNSEEFESTVSRSEQSDDL